MNGTAARRSPAVAVSEWKPGSVAGGWDLADYALPARTGSDSARRGATPRGAHAAIDFLLACLGGAAAFWLRFGPANPFGAGSLTLSETFPQISVRAYPGFLVLYAALVVVSCMGQNLYRTAREQSTVDEFLEVAKAVFLATALLVLVIFTSGNKEISKLVIAGAGTLTLSVLAGWRYAKRRYVQRRTARGEGVSRVLIVGAGKMGKALAAWFGENRELGYNVCGFLDPHTNGDTRVLGTVQELRSVALAQFVDQLFITLPADRELVKEVFLEARRLRLNLKVVPDLYDGLGWRAPVQTIGGFPVIELHGQPIPALGLAAKRAMDLLGAFFGLVLTFPILALAAIWIRLDSPGPVFYSALRVGKKGRRFRCYKLRTMVAEAEAQKEQLRGANERSGPFFKMENDPRVTRCGHWLRKYSIDELPQLLNVLLGDMSLVGPRPHPLDDFERYGIEHLRRLDVKPGMTGLWQVTARGDPSFEVTMAHDLKYIEQWSLRLDTAVLLKTIPIVFRAQGN